MDSEKTPVAILNDRSNGNAVNAKVMVALPLQKIWFAHQTLILRIAIAVMAAAAVVFLTYEFWRLLFQSNFIGAIDLKQRYLETRCLFSGGNPYRQLKTAMYPPASYVMLWPFVGWLKIGAVRWLWAITTIASLALLSYLTVRISRADTPLLRTLVALLPFSMYATGATIGNGQLPIHCLTALMLAIFLLQKPQRTWREDSFIASFFLFALVKPALAAPFFWIILLKPGGIRPAIVVGVGYAVLTWFGASFQELNSLQLFAAWHERAAAGVEWSNAAASAIWGHAMFEVNIYGLINVSGLLSALGLGQWNLPVSLLTLTGLGIWIYFHRGVDIWVLAGVAAFVDRFWTYHMWYDDLLILLPMIALLRIIHQESTTLQRRWRAGILFAMTTIVMLAPGGLYLFPPPWNQLYVGVQTLLWLAGLLFLLQQARLEKRMIASAVMGHDVRATMRETAEEIGSGLIKV
jgi:hypothetical protein